MIARKIVQISDPIITNAAETIPIALIGCSSVGRYHTVKCWIGTSNFRMTVDSTTNVVQTDVNKVENNRKPLTEPTCP